MGATPANPVATITVVGTDTAIMLQHGDSEFRDITHSLATLTPDETQAVRVAVYTMLRSIQRNVLPNLRGGLPQPF